MAGFRFWPFFPAYRSICRLGARKTKPAGRRVPGGEARRLTAAIDAAVVVVVVLAVMLLAMDAGALRVLRLMQAGALAAGHDTVGLGAVFHVIDMLLAAFQAIGFALGQAAGGNALVDALLLVGLALIDARRIGLGEGQRRQNDGKEGDGLDGFHVFLQWFRANSLSRIRR